MNLNQNKGYVGYSMSVRANNAYINNIMPKSKWTKSEILNIVEEANNKLDLELLSSFTKEQLQDIFLFYDSWHHTSKLYNKTDFYKIDKDYVSSLTNDDLIEQREHFKNQKNKEYDVVVDINENNKNEYLKFFNISNYKTEEGFLKAIKYGRLKIENLIKSQKRKFEKETLKYKYLTDYKSDKAFLKAIETNKVNLDDLKEQHLLNENKKEINQLKGLIPALIKYKEQKEILLKDKNNIKAKEFVENNFKYGIVTEMSIERLESFILNLSDKLNEKMNLYNEKSFKSEMLDLKNKADNFNKDKKSLLKNKEIEL